MMPSKRKKNEARKVKEGEERKQKVTLKTATMSLLNPKTIAKFAFCTCLNFANKYFASGSEGREVYDL